MTKRFTDPFTIIIPVYNEEDLIVENTKKLLRYLNSFDAPFEIIIVSNGSTDMTIKLGKKLEAESSNIRFFHLNKRKVGNAFKLGVRKTHYENIISLDMDLSVDLIFIKEALGLLKRFDIIIGSKRTGKQKRSLLRRIGSSVYIFFSRNLLKLDYYDYSMSAKGYRVKSIEKYLDTISSHTSYVIDLIHYASRDKLKLIEIPVACEDIRGSKFNLLHEGFSRFLYLFKLWIKNWSYK
jgi:glycosyltransferase involved in cell wall biosynthesis